LVSSDYGLAQTPARKPDPEEVPLVMDPIDLLGQRLTAPAAGEG
jgi:hypothetical protein